MSTFEISDLFTILPKLAPMLPEIKDAIAEFEQIATDPAAIAAVAEAQKVMADPKLKQTIDTCGKLAALLKAAQATIPTWQQS